MKKFLELFYILNKICSDLFHSIKLMCVLSFGMKMKVNENDLKNITNTSLLEENCKCVSNERFILQVRFLNDFDLVE